MFWDDIERIAPHVLPLVKATGVGSFDELYALTRQFPSLANDGLYSLPELSNLAAVRASQAVGAALAPALAPATFAKGAFVPPQSVVGSGYQVSTSIVVAAGGVAVGSAISHASPTAVRDQGLRSTCVAHAFVGGAEFSYQQGTLSPQFCYWAAKLHGEDPFPANDGTWLRCAGGGVDTVGLCDEPSWQYDMTLIAGNQTHQQAGSAPSAHALSDALSRRRHFAHYEDVSAVNRGKAAILLRELQHGPVAISLPVFQDDTTGVENWTWYGATEFGHVLDPVQNSFVIDGHAVCVFGYQPSPVASGGGWFIFKNSWGTRAWSNGSATPPAQHPVWRAGYGYCSAEYVNKYLWELLRV